MVQDDGGVLGQKVELFFVCVFSKKYMETVWDIQRRVPTDGVTSRGAHPKNLAGNDRKE